MSTAAEGYPRLTFQEVANKYHSADEPGFKTGFDGACVLKAKLLEGQKLPMTFGPPTSVSHHHVRSVTCWVEFGFITEADVTRLFKVGSSVLKLGKGVKVQIEDGSYLSGWLIRLRGMPVTELASLRRIRVEVRQEIDLTEELLASGNQIRSEQPHEIWEVMGERQEEKATGGSLTSKSLQKLHTLESLLEKANAVLQEGFQHYSLLNLCYEQVQCCCSVVNKM